MSSTLPRRPLSSVRARAPGKINVSFQVGPQRQDGYHSVASVYLAVSLYEEVTATATDSGRITVGLRSGAAVTAAGQPTLVSAEAIKKIPLNESNLAVRAAQLLAAATGNRTGVHLELTKRVPVAGGMGGGSADAAAALVACDALFGSGLSRHELGQLGSQLGADVPFALFGGAAVGLGTGSELSPALTGAALHWVLVGSDFGLSTPQVYAALDRLRAEAGYDAEAPAAVNPRVLEAMRSPDPGGLSDVLRNDLQPAAIDLAPQLADVLALGEQHGALAGMISGSGPTIAFLAEDEERAELLAASLEQSGAAAIAVHGPVPGARIVAEVPQ